MKNSYSSRIMVIGDVILDEYQMGKIHRISPESPVPIFNYERTYYRLGGAANVGANLMDAFKVELLSITGADDHSGKIFELCEAIGLGSDQILRDSSRKTTVKTRLLVDNHHVLRIDIEDASDISSSLEVKLFDLFVKKIDDVDTVILSDYAKGVLSLGSTKKILEEAKCRGKKTFVDVKGNDPLKYKNAFLLKPNIKELSMLTGMTISSEEDICRAMSELKKLTEAEVILVTRSEKGYILLNEQNEFVSGQSRAQEVFDVTGAGDTFIAYLTFFYTEGNSIEKAAELANIASGIKVSKVGTVPVKVEEIEEALNLQQLKNVIVDRDHFIRNRKYFSQKKIVFTNGCYDILHIGHIQYLKKASELGDLLVVGVNSDASVKRIKGEGRPILAEADRVNMLAELDFIDHVVLFEEDTPYELIKAVKPDILVKGGDYDVENIVGKDIVESYGGVVSTIPFVEGYSTTEIINKISRSLKGE